MIATDALEKLSGIAISRRDRQLIHWALAFCGAVIIGLIGFGKDIELHRIAMNAAWWTGAALIIVFVAGTVENRRIAARTITPQRAEPSPVTVNASSPAMAADVNSIKDDVNTMAKKAKK